MVGYTPKWKKLTGEVEEKIRQGSVTYCIHPQCSTASTGVKLITPSFVKQLTTMKQLFT